MRYSRQVLAIVVLIFFSGCFAVLNRDIDNAIRQHSDLMPQIQLGESIEKVRGLLEPIQQQMRANARKPPDRFLKDGVEVYIYYARSGRQPDGLTTDDEFTPYVFQNGKLVAVGWATLGGPKTHGQATSDTYINVQQTVK